MVAGSSIAPRSRGSATWTDDATAPASRRCGLRGPRRLRVPLLDFWPITSPLSLRCRHARIRASPFVVLSASRFQTRREARPARVSRAHARGRCSRAPCPSTRRRRTGRRHGRVPGQFRRCPCGRPATGRSAPVLVSAGSSGRPRTSAPGSASGAIRTRAAPTTDTPSAAFRRRVGWPASIFLASRRRRSLDSRVSVGVASSGARAASSSRRPLRGRGGRRRRLSRRSRPDCRGRRARRPELPDSSDWRRAAEASSRAALAAAFASRRARASATDTSLRMSIRHPVSFAASRAFWPSRPIASESIRSGTTTFAIRCSSSIVTSEDLRRAQRVGDEDRRVVVPGDDVDLLAAELGHHRLDPRASLADRGADRVEAVLAARDRDLGAAARLARDRLDLDGPRVDLRNLELEQSAAGSPCACG